MSTYECTCGERFDLDVELEEHRLTCYGDYDGENEW